LHVHTRLCRSCNGPMPHSTRKSLQCHVRVLSLLRSLDVQVRQDLHDRQLQRHLVNHGVHSQRPYRHLHCQCLGMNSAFVFLQESPPQAKAVAYLQGGFRERLGSRTMVMPRSRKVHLLLCWVEKISCRWPRRNPFPRSPVAMQRESGTVGSPHLTNQILRPSHPRSCAKT